jgi:hypothetical protein
MPKHTPRRSTFASIFAHARRRCAQRGTNSLLLNAVHDWADIEVAVGNGATSLSLSQDAADAMRSAGLSSDIIDRARRRAVVQIEGRTLTVIAGRDRRGLHYRRCIRPGSDRGRGRRMRA